MGNEADSTFFSMDLNPMVMPEKFYINNCKVANTLPAESNLKDGFPMYVEPMKNKKIKIMVDITGDDNIQLSNNRITLFDMAVMDAAYTLFTYKHRVFTPEMIVRIMACKMDLDVTKQKKAAVIASLEKLRMINIEIDCTEEFKARHLIKSDVSRAIIKSYLLPLSEISVTPAFHNEVVKGYRFLEKPALYTYAEYSRQIINATMDVLNIEGLSMTEEVIILRNYLYRRISSMKNTKNSVRSRHIVYERKDGCKGLMPDIGYGLEYKKKKPKYYNRKKSAIHDKVLHILDSFQGKDFIKGYKVILKGTGGAIYGIDIIL